MMARAQEPDFAEEVAEMMRSELRLYSDTERRGAMRGGLRVAAAICDMLKDRIEQRHRRGKKVTIRGLDLAAVAKACGDQIWAAREKVTVS